MISSGFDEAGLERDHGDAGQRPRYEAALLGRLRQPLEISRRQPGDACLGLQLDTGQRRSGPGGAEMRFRGRVDARGV